MEYRFAQVLHGKLYKRTLFIVLVVLVHINSNFKEVIRLSFHGKIQEAIVLTNYQWLMLYPCLYFFAMWDAFKEAGGGVNPFSYLPFVCSAAFVTAELLFSSKVKVFGITLGTMWFPMLCVFPGLLIGISLKRILNGSYTSIRFIMDD
ncbi:hypothetical protein [Cytobacillus oceanisediminis]|uniref:hypothetical protein n=1 Tax=Cytobacillus oceanisediminis TaxID=665099 RepID=UPI0032B4225D